MGGLAGVWVEEKDEDEEREKGKQSEQRRTEKKVGVEATRLDWAGLAKSCAGMMADSFLWFSFVSRSLFFWCPKSWMDGGDGAMGFWGVAGGLFGRGGGLWCLVCCWGSLVYVIIDDGFSKGGALWCAGAVSGSR